MEPRLRSGRSPPTGTAASKDRAAASRGPARSRSRRTIRTAPCTTRTSVSSRSTEAAMIAQPLSRRSFLGAAVAAPFAFTTALRGAVRDVPIGLELYSVRTELAKDLLATVAAVGKIGYQVV